MQYITTLLNPYNNVAFTHQNQFQPQFHLNEQFFRRFFNHDQQQNNFVETI